MKNIRAYFFPAAIITGYAVLTFYVMLHHEPWRDEAQFWLFARDLDFISLWRHIHYEGTPALWHLLLMPFAKSGCPYLCQSIINFIVAASATAIFVFRSGFSILTKAAFAFSYFMAYEYSVIARSYSVSILLLFLIASFYGRRFKRPILYSLLVTLLFNTNAYSMATAFALTVLFAFEIIRQREARAHFCYTGLGIMILGLAATLWQTIPAPDMWNSVTFSPKCGLIAVMDAFFPVQFFSNVISASAYIASGILIIAVSALSIIRKPAVLFVLFLSYTGLFYIFIFRVGGALRHHGFILILLLFSFWIGTYYRPYGTFSPSTQKGVAIFENLSRKLSISLITFCLLVSIVYAVAMQNLEIKYLFSGSGEMADFIIKNHLSEYTIAAHQAEEAQAILPYLPGKKLWYIGAGEYGTFTTCNSKYMANREMGNKEAIREINDVFGRDANILLLLSRPLSEPASHGFALLHETPGPVFGYFRERYWLYKRANTTRSGALQSKGRGSLPEAPATGGAEGAK